MLVQHVAKLNGDANHLCQEPLVGVEISLILRYVSLAVLGASNFSLPILARFSSSVDFIRRANHEQARFL